MTAGSVYTFLSLCHVAPLLGFMPNQVGVGDNVTESRIHRLRQYKPVRPRSDLGSKRPSPHIPSKLEFDEKVALVGRKEGRAQQTALPLLVNIPTPKKTNLARQVAQQQVREHTKQERQRLVTSLFRS